MAKKFESLTLALDGWFNTDRLELPDALRKRVEFEFFPAPWDNLSSSQRRSAALQLDYQNDPTTELDRRKWSDFLGRKYELEKQILHWETIACHTASEWVQKESRLKELRQEFSRMELQQRQVRGDYYPERKSLDAEKIPTLKSDYIAFPKSMKILAERLRATPEELAMWIFMGPATGGIAAYRNANELDRPPRFYFDNFMGEDYVSPLMACWFRQDDIDRFDPADRYITGAALIDRWSKSPAIKPEAYIRAKIAESRLTDIHPIYGGTQGTSPGNTSYPPLTIGLFALAEIEAIEAEDFDAAESVDKSAAGSCQPVSAAQIRQYFQVTRDADTNDTWWKEKMADAERYGLRECRVGEGKKGRGGGSLWRPDMIAGWLVDRYAKGRDGLPVDAARKGLRQFPGCEDIAEQMFPQGE
jgi:hypothetical protein